MTVAVRRQIIVSGFVQGVSFRKQTARVAAHLGVRGWVRNVSNGTVEACLEGDERTVDALTAWCAFGPPKGRVDAVTILTTVPGSVGADFCIREDRRID